MDVPGNLTDTKIQFSTVSDFHLSCFASLWTEGLAGHLAGKTHLAEGSHKDLPRNGHANRKAVPAVKIDASFSSMGRKHILGTAAASGEDTLIDRNMKGVPGKQDAGTPGPQFPYLSNRAKCCPVNRMG